MCWVHAVFPDGGESWGTGALIGPQDVLTTAHIAYHDGKWAKTIEVIPGFSPGSAAGKQQPLGSSTAAWRKMIGAGAKAPSNLEDILYVRLKKKLGKPKGYFGVAYEPVVNNARVRYAGYGYTPPGTANGVMSTNSGYIQMFGPPLTAVGFSGIMQGNAVSGDSGAPIWNLLKPKTQPNGYYFLGVLHAGQGHLISAMYINSKRNNEVKKMRAASQAP